MSRFNTMQSPLLFEELEPRLLFSADIAAAVAVDAVEQDYSEEPVVTADLETEADAGDAAADSPAGDGAAPADPAAGDEVAGDEVAAGDEAAATEPTDSPAGEPADDASGQTSAGEDDTGGDDATAVAAEAGTESGSSEPDAGRELVFVNDNVQDYGQLVDDLRQGSDNGRSLEVVILDDGQDGIGQVTQVLKNYNDLDAIHFVTHGSEGSLALGSTWLDSSGLMAASDAISAWGKSLGADADILLYGCNIGAGEDGLNLTGTLARLTGADVAASDDNTGSLDLGGDWSLEYSFGSIDTDLAVGAGARQQWQGLLAAGDGPPVVATPGPALNYSENDPATAIDPTATVVDIDSPNFNQGTLTVSFSAGGTVDDELTIIEGGGVELLNDTKNIKVDGVVVGHCRDNITIGTLDTPLVIDWTSQGTPSVAERVMRQIAYRNTSDDPSTVQRTVDFVLADGDGGIGNTAQQFINVTGINDPVGAVTDSNAAANTVAENAAVGAPVGIAALATDADGADTIVYSLSDDAGGRFAIDAGTGAIAVAGSLDYENAASHNVTVLATSTDASVSSQVFTIMVGDVDENPVVDPPEPDPDPAGDGEEETGSGDGGSPVGDDRVDPPDTGDETAAVPPPVNEIPDPPPVEQAWQYPGSMGIESGDVDAGPLGGSEDDQAWEQVREGDSWVVVENQREDEIAFAVTPADTIVAAGYSSYDAGPAPSADGASGARSEARSSSPHPQRPTGRDYQLREQTHVGALLKTVRTAVKETLDFIVPTATAAPLSADPSSPDRVDLANETLRQQIDAMQWEIDQGSEESGEENRLVVYTASGVSISVTAGVVSYLLRSGSLMSSFLATIPLWKGFDPVAILNGPGQVAATVRQATPQRPSGENAAQASSAEDQQAEDIFTEKED